jgi:hypothetical protein
MMLNPSIWRAHLGPELKAPLSPGMTEDQIIEEGKTMMKLNL